MKRMNRNIIRKFHEGIASEAEKEAIREWLEADKANIREVLDERALIDSILMRLAPGGAGISRRHGGPPMSLRYKFIKCITAAVIAAIAFAGGMLIKSVGMKDYSTMINSVSAPAGQRAKVILPDSTVVWLNARTEIRYRADFMAKGERKVELDGEAYFDVSHVNGKPFVVQTDRCEVEVSGTVFNLDAYGNTGRFSLALLEGKVKVTDNTDPSNSIILTPANKAGFESGLLTSAPIEPGDYDSYRWREGLICFKDLVFEQLLQRLEKCYEVTISNNNPKLPGYEISGKLRITDGIDNALRVLQKEARYTFTRDSETNIINIY
jgi:ferric-dicitrate binding protein FerR (iron transport regulator)